MSHLMGEAFPVHKATIVSRGEALGYTLHLPEEDRYLHTKEEFIDYMKIVLAGRAAEQIVFGRVTNGAANDLQKVTDLARSMVFEYGMSDGATSRTMRADNYALSEETKRMRDSEQARLTDQAYAEAVRLLHQAPRRRSTGSPRPCWRRRRSSATRCERSSPTSSPSRARPSRRRRASRPGDPGHVPLGGHRFTRNGPSSIGPWRRRRIHHLGIAVADLDEALDTYDAALRRRARAPRDGRRAGRRGGRDRSATSRVELLAALGEDTPVGRFLAKRGPGMHHVAYEVEDVRAALAGLAARRCAS